MSELSRWRRESAAVDPTGVVLLHYRRTADNALVVIEVAPPDPSQRALIAAPFGNLSYRELVGAEPRDAVALIRDFVAAMGDADRSALNALAKPVPPAIPAPEVDRALAPHLFALHASGYTIVRGVLDRARVERLAAEAGSALDRSKQLIQARGPLSHSNLEVYDPQTFVANRALYCWGDTSRGLVEDPFIERLASATLGAHRLHEMAVQAALPANGADRMRTEQWHRDVDLETTERPIEFLWFMFPIDHFTAENGATWVVPGSQRLLPQPIPTRDFALDRFPSRVQLVVERGDLIALNPSVLHTWGYNATDRDRRMVNVMMCRRDAEPVLDHWTIAGPRLTERASARLRAILGGDLPRTGNPMWDALPDGWVTGTRPR